MPILMFLRQYGLREYAITLGVAALVGIGIAVMINSAAGGAGAPAVLKTKQELADASSRVLTTRVFKPVSESRPAPNPVVRHHRRHRTRHATPAPAPAPRIVVAQAPAPKPKLQPVVSRPAPAPVVHTPAPAPVVHRPAPAPRPKPASKPSGGGSVQFDDSG